MPPPLEQEAQPDLAVDALGGVQDVMHPQVPILPEVSNGISPSSQENISSQVADPDFARDPLLDELNPYPSLADNDFELFLQDLDIGDMPIPSHPAPIPSSEANLVLEPPQPNVDDANNLLDAAHDGSLGL